MQDTAAPSTLAAPPAHYANLSLAQRLLAMSFVVVGAWYLWWRPSSFNPEAPVFSAVIYAGELFGFACALLFLFMCWRLKQRAPLPPLRDATVAVFVPTINEPVEMLRRTLLAAQRMEHASEVWLLDDGNRAEMRELAAALGCRYLARTENSHAKAGNLNHALSHTRAELIAIFDADHAPAPDFLAETLGFFADERVAFVQTPQDFYNLDSFQHRVDRDGARVWSEQTLFFRVIQSGKDRLNSAFFCGSCAVIRRRALDDIGGFATGTVTEDIHTSLRLHRRGWRSVYYARSLAFGLAPSTALPFLKQRLRWGQGAMQVWRREGVLFARGLTLGQRLSYLATMLAYFEGWQRAVFFLAPVVVLTTGVLPIAVVDREFLLRFVPYYVLTFWVFEEVSRGYGRTLLTEQYNMVRFAVFITATFGYFLRRLRFVVTPKQLGSGEPTRKLMWPQFLVLALNVIAIPTGIVLHVHSGMLPTGALVMNVMWASLTAGIALLAIGFALRVARFRRREYRFPLPVPLHFASGATTSIGLATDISSLGFRLIGAPVTTASPGDRIAGELLLPTGRLPIEASVRIKLPAGDDGNASESIGCEFRWSSVVERDQLELFLFGSDLQWRLNGLEDRVPTPLDRLRMALGGARDERALTAGQRWLPLLYRRGGGATESSVGFISAADPKARRRTIVSLGALSPHERLYAEEVTATGPRGVSGRVADEEVLETHAAPLYLYRLTA